MVAPVASYTRSATTSGINRFFPAPIDTRSSVSRARPAAWAISKLATFAQEVTWVTGLNFEHLCPILEAAIAAMIWLHVMISLHLRMCGQ
jgi:hypothetical protein